ncbi:MAG: glutamate-5-semialdehyde dehydrogenase [Lachnospiraceae bacterium]|nr:glutamate-5-semialdehyde dehydrogenase [Lachnospiraceae bacterium]
MEIFDEKTEYLEGIGKKARRAEAVMRILDTEKKNEALKLCAKALTDNADSILSANEEDLITARENGMKESMIDRLKFTKERIEAMAEGLIQVCDLPDPVGHVLESFERPNGLKIERVSVPLGVVGIIYESRPNVTADAFALTFKSGNVTVLKGGSDAIKSNGAIVKVLRQTLKDNGFAEDALLFIDSTDRAVTTAFMKMNRYIDVLIPRGGAGLIRAAVENATIPVIETGTGNCHVYVDESADCDMAVKIIHNAKTQRLGVCNACESLVIHEKIADKVIPMICADLKSAGIEIRGDEKTRRIIDDIKAATDEDYYTEYADAIISVCIVGSLSEAIEHINAHSTHHSEAIVTNDEASAERFLNEVDSAAVYVNASTRFTDGFEFGFGAEIGISTQKLHARGPMGLRELTSYKFKIRGTGQVRG